MITVDILLEFEEITGKPVTQFFRKTLDFLQHDYPTLEAYYTGSTSSITSNPFAKLTMLEAEAQLYLNAFQIHGAQLTNSKWWYLLEQIEDLHNRLQTVRNIRRWTRSTRSNSAFSSKLEFNYVMPAGQTLERIAQDLLHYSVPQDDWIDIAIRNNIREEDYTTDGGVNLTLSAPVATGSVQIGAVVDSMEGKKILGKDLHRALQFVDNDLQCLNEDDTIFQSVQILAGLKANDNPYVPNDGLQSAVILGANRASLNFPVISRQMTATFASDDTLQDFAIREINVENDTLNVSYQVRTRLNETIDATITF